MSSFSRDAVPCTPDTPVGPYDISNQNMSFFTRPGPALRGEDETAEEVADETVDEEGFPFQGVEAPMPAIGDEPSAEKIDTDGAEPVRD